MEPGGAGVGRRSAGLEVGSVIGRMWRGGW